MPSLSHEIKPTAAENWDFRGSYHHSAGLEQLPHSRGANKDNEKPLVNIQSLLIDADPASVATLRTRLLNQCDFEVPIELSSEKNALAQISALQPDAIFIDVETMELFGLDLAKILHQPASPVVVFLTKYRDYAIRAFDLGAADYLLKPIRDDRFAITLNRIRERLTHQRVARGIPPLRMQMERLSRHQHPFMGRITVTDRKQTRLIEVQDIEWIGAAGDYAELHVRDSTYLLREPLSVLMNRLPANVFCRIHRSFAVNLSWVSGFKALRNQDLLVKLKDKTILRASRTFSDNLRRAITRQCA